jgi:hypothetical protein
MLPKSVASTVTYIPTGWTTHRVVELQQGPKDQVHNTTHTGFNVRARFGLKQAQPPQNLQPPLVMFLSRGLTCYTDVEQWSRRLIPKPNRLPNVRPRAGTRMHRR